MITLFEQQLKEQSCHSSKGNQLKWESNGVWYKADYTGYEGLAEYVVSRLLGFSNLQPEEFVRYELEDIQYLSQVFLAEEQALRVDTTRRIYAVLVIKLSGDLTDIA